MVTMNILTCYSKFFMTKFLMLVKCAYVDFSFLKYLLMGCIGDMSICGDFFPTIFTKGCGISTKYPK